jgi:hypothetical protein
LAQKCFLDIGQGRKKKKKDESIDKLNKLFIFLAVEDFICKNAGT